VIRDGLNVSEFALPNNQSKPTHRVQFPLIRDIALSVSVEFSPPEAYSGFGCSRECTAGMTVPKAAMDEDDPATAGKYEIRATGQVLAMETIPKAESVD